jgi:prophage regulatory protein
MVAKAQGYPEPRNARLLRLPEVKRQVGLGRSSIYAKAKAGEFPAPVNLGGRAVAWLDHEIQSWIDARVADSRRGVQP